MGCHIYVYVAIGQRALCELLKLEKMLSREYVYIIDLSATHLVPGLWQTSTTFIPNFIITIISWIFAINDNDFHSYCNSYYNWLLNKIKKLIKYINSIINYEDIIPNTKVEPSIEETGYWNKIIIFVEIVVNIAFLASTTIAS